MNTGSRHVELSAANIARAGASPILALDPGAIGRLVALTPAKPVARREAAGIVSIRGPLAQRAIHDLCGHVDGYDAITRRFMAALEDPDVDAVILDVDSPGGDVAGLEQAVERMRAAQKKSGKPVFAFVNELAASAAYWIVAALSTDGISMPRAGCVGSIGCIGGLVDETGALEAQGIAVTLVRAPAGKAEAHPAGPVKPLAEDRMLARVTAVAERFFSAMAQARGLSMEQIRDLNAEVLEGDAALKARLADRIEDFESVVARAQSAGRVWRRRTEKKAMDEKELSDLKAFERQALSMFGALDRAAFVGVSAAAKQALDAAPELNARLAAAEQNLSTLQKQFDDAEAVRLIDAAQAAKKIVPANRDKALAFYSTQGLKSLAAFLDALVPVAGVEPKALEPQARTEAPAAIMTSAHAPAAPAQGASKPFEKMLPMDRHEYRRVHGEEAYQALKQDWIRRGSPR